MPKRANEGEHASHKRGKVSDIKNEDITRSSTPPPIFTNVNVVKEEKTSPVANEPDYLKLILTANVYSGNVVKETPLFKAVNLSNRVGNNILLKREDLQDVFSFKIRGAYNKILQLTEEEKKRGVIACSAGNHAQGVALSSNKLGIKATIVMPTMTPPIKVNNVKRLGGNVVLHGVDFAEAKAKCEELTKEKGYVNIPPYDDPLVIAGQGTIAMEILRQQDPNTIHSIFVPVGGGGLVAGIAAYVKRICPKIKVVGVETYDADCMFRSLKMGKIQNLPEVGLFADGTAVRQVGTETFRLCQKYVDEIILVNTDEICAAVKDVFEDTRSILEPSGASSVAGAKKYLAEKNLHGVNAIAVTSGANMNFDRLRFVAERTGYGEQNEALISVTIPEEPGSFHKLYDVVAPRAVTEFAYRFGDEKMAKIFMSFNIKKGTTRKEDVANIIKELSKRNMNGIDLSKNELAKLHARYLIGGRKHVPNERLYRFIFPERPGALKHFLDSLKGKWNVSLFHYRNNGGDVANVLVGIQVPKEDNTEFEKFLKNTKFPYVDETENEVYKIFLK